MELTNLQWLQAAIDGAEPPEMMADWLEDQGADLASVLHLFAGIPPLWVQGIPREAVVCWLTAHGDERAGAVAGVKTPPAPVSWRKGSGFVSADDDCLFVGYREEGLAEHKPHTLRPEGCLVCERRGATIVPALSLSCVRRVVTSGNRPVFWARCPQCSTVAWALADNAPEVQAMKRSVLALFPEVLLPQRVVCPGCSQCKGWAAMVRDSGCGGTGCRWTGKEVSAAVLIE